MCLSREKPLQTRSYVEFIPRPLRVLLSDEHDQGRGYTSPACDASTNSESTKYHSAATARLPEALRVLPSTAHQLRVYYNNVPVVVGALDRLAPKSSVEILRLRCCVRGS